MMHTYIVHSSSKT